MRRDRLDEIFRMRHRKPVSGHVVVLRLEYECTRHPPVEGKGDFTMILERWRGRGIHSVILVAQVVELRSDLPIGVEAIRGKHVSASRRFIPYLILVRNLSFERQRVSA